MSNPFYWNQKSLDEVCARLHDFSTLLFSTKDAQDLEVLWGLVRDRLYPNIQSASLQTYFFDERTQSLDELKSTQAKTADVILFRKKTEAKAWDQSLFKLLAELPGAVLAFSDQTPANWNPHFDIVLELREPICKIYRRSQTGSEDVPFSFSEKASTGAAPITSATPQKNMSTLYFLEVDQTTQKTLSRGITFNSIQTAVLDLDQAVPNFRRGDFLITDLSEDHPKLEDFIDRAKSNSVPVAVIGKNLKRVEDRLRLYEWGATTVLPKEASATEQMAAIIALLRFSGHHEVTPLFAMEEWDEELQRLSHKVKRDLSWKKDQFPELVEYYKAFVAHLIKRSHHSGTPCGVVRIPLPDLSALVAKKESWINLMRRTLLQSLIATVRQRDITFVYEDHLVVISGDLSPLSSTYVVKRIQSQLESLGEKSVKVERFSFQPDTKDRNEEAEELLKKSVKGLVGTSST